ncbi:saccharopine dehydrogenase-like oxidoreductase [Physella acuta]|uniref:saccharopine dehydrogenase-like oxidoreductase n=1 Tax=Physella acuta TaxID=109671 RepID=UPI0027DD8A30|nr:saccharopine dehydrogenase-like oxidoreductase [Physella acuta]XP_059163769.1 saccharopine dehydrogenase-like oxidoreductase [Physella acuta]XP_059163770.1 saccharopine dehydrogenase-like oxidoreductase [Physella acuta]XP_059163771.1 saccharopine dehydrogenase-like oxidoreductase [Physella acuta]
MSQNRYDLVLFGASGFTGHYTIDEVSKVAEEENLTWAVAGRNMNKLQKVLSEASVRTGKNLDDIPIIIADVDSAASLEEMAKQAKIVLNCVGPYRFYGEAVVKACIENGAHHLDISGEPQFLEKVQLLYNAKAKENNVFVIGTVGFDSIPAEMGIEYTKQQFKDGEMTNVESFVEFHSGPEGSAVNTGTFESAVYGLAHWNELKSLRKSLYPEPMPKYQYRLPKRSFLYYHNELKKWCLPFPGSDKSVFYRTQRELLDKKQMERPIEFNPYFCPLNLCHAIGTIFFGIIFFILTNFSLGRSLLLKYPHIVSFGVFRKGGPTKKQIDGASFSMTFIGHGFEKFEKDRSGQKPNKKVITKIIGPEPGYVATPIFMVQSAVTLIRNESKLSQKGGVFTPGVIFKDTDLIERLQRDRIQFITVSSGSGTDKKQE